MKFKFNLFEGLIIGFFALLILVFLAVWTGAIVLQVLSIPKLSMAILLATLLLIASVWTYIKRREK